jgi:hypothetical protein
MNGVGITSSGLFMYQKIRSKVAIGVLSFFWLIPCGTQAQKTETIAPGRSTVIVKVLALNVVPGSLRRTSKDDLIPRERILARVVKVIRGTVEGEEIVVRYITGKVSSSIATQFANSSDFWKFELQRNPDCDQVIRENVPVFDVKTNEVFGSLPSFEVAKFARKDEVPIDVVLPCYDLRSQKIKTDA